MNTARLVASPEYVFKGADKLPEIERLKLIERIFDAKTISMIRSSGGLQGKACLEIGYGAGSILKWISKEAGHKGKAVGIDLRIDLFKEKFNRIRLIEGDFRKYDFKKMRFGFIHARYTLMHIKHTEKVFNKIRHISGDDCIVLVEEPDFTDAGTSGDDARSAGFNRVCEAVRSMYDSMGVDYAIGKRLASFLEKSGFKVMRQDVSEHIAAGGTPMACMMTSSVAAIREKLQSTGKAMDEDLNHYRDFANDDRTLACYYRTVSVLARRK